MNTNNISLRAEIRKCYVDTPIYLELLPTLIEVVLMGSPLRSTNYRVNNSIFHLFYDSVGWVTHNFTLRMVLIL